MHSSYTESARSSDSVRAPDAQVKHIHGSQLNPAVMMITAVLVVMVARVTCGTTITHELPRISPYGHYGGYVSPLRPGARWSYHRSLPLTRYHPHHLDLSHSLPRALPPHSPPHRHHVMHLPLPTVSPAEPPPSETFSIEDEAALVETAREARENSEDEETYKFGYAVKDDSQADDFSHQVSHDGRRTEGEYRVALPDGRVQVCHGDDRGRYSRAYSQNMRSKFLSD